MDTSREDVGIAIRSAFFRKGTKQKFSLLALIFISILLIFAETIETKPLNKIRSFIKDIVYRSATAVSFPAQSFESVSNFVESHLNLYSNYKQLKAENETLKNNISSSDFLKLENSQLKELIEEQIESPSNIISARVIFDKQSPYLNSFVINIGTNKNLKNGLAVLDKKNFVGRVVDVNFFSSRVLLISDLNSKIPVISEPSGVHGILSGHGENPPTLEYLPENHEIKNGDKIYTSGKEGIFSPGIPIGEAKLEKNLVSVSLFSDLSQISYVNINIGDNK